jgi:TRAP-type uncharacterized transport system substrate-binding protein
MSNTGQRSILRSLGGGRWALALGLVGLASAALFLFERREAHAERLTLTAGYGGTTRELLARALVQDLKHRGVNAELIESRETANELELVESGGVDLAFVSGAFRLGRYEHVREMAPLHNEALHVLVKKERLEAIDPTLHGLRGLRIDVGPAGSATSVLAGSVLAFAGLLESRDFVAEQHEIPELEAALAQSDCGSLADAIFHLATVPSKVALGLVRSCGYALVPIPFTDAFRLESILRHGSVEAEEATLERAYTQSTVIPPFTYQLDPPVPADAMPTLGSRLLLVANERVPAASVEKVLHAIYTSRFANLAQPPLERAEVARGHRLRRHEGTERFLARGQPLLDASDVDKLNNTLGVLGALVGGGLFLWQGLRQRRQSQRERAFAAHVSRVAAVERRIVELELSAQLELEPLIALQRDLLEQKSEALDRFTAGELGDHRALSELMAPIDASRDRVGALLLHVREGLERQAKSEGRSVGAVWEEAAEPSAEG